jgi:PKD repeat protein
VDAAASTDPDGTITAYDWAFGDGSTASGTTASHSYAAPGTYPVTLTVTDDEGDTDQLTVDVTVEEPNQLPTAAFTAATDAAEVQVDASGSTDPDGTVTSYDWEFGDGGTATGATASHVYADPGTYPVTLTVTDNRGGTDSVTQDVTVTEGSEPVTTTVIQRDGTWQWYYATPAPPTDWSAVGGDRSGWQTGAAPLGWGFADVATNIDIDGPSTDRPRAAFFATEFEIVDPGRVLELELDTVANDGVVVYVNGVEVGRHNMPAGDITHLTFASSARRVAAADADPVVIDVPLGLLVEGTNVVAASTHLNYRNTPDLGFGLEAELTALQSGPVNQPPAAVFDAAVDGLTVSVDASGSSDPESDLASHAWSFGDGTTGTGATADHTYAAPGVYQVTLTVTDGEGASDVASEDVVVTDGSEPATTTVIERNALWEWYHDLEAPTTNWAAVNGDRAGWQSGGAALGWGFDGVETDIYIEGDAADRPRAAYFATEFDVADPGRVVELELDTVANDGVVVYVNGVEVDRHNMPDGEVTHDTFASSARRVTAADADPVVIDVPVDLLVEGTNVVAASTHVNYRNTPDVSFELDAAITTV